MIWRTTRFEIGLDQPRVMGIVNLTPDSFSDGDPSAGTVEAVARCRHLLAAGADILDLGAESSRPGAAPVGVDEELARLLPVLREAVLLGCPVSVDTCKPEVMKAALAAGADIINDVDALTAPGALDVVAAHPACGVCLMHRRGDARTMRTLAHYGDVVAEVGSYLRERHAAVCSAGIDAARIVVDPGLGFAKDAAQNLELLARQEELLSIGAPLLVGWSRKSTLARLAGLSATPAAERTATQRALLDTASAVAAVIAVQRGARVVRVHDVAGTVAALAVNRAASVPHR